MTEAAMYGHVYCAQMCMRTLILIVDVFKLCPDVLMHIIIIIMHTSTAVN